MLLALYSGRIGHIQGRVGKWPADCAGSIAIVLRGRTVYYTTLSAINRPAERRRGYYLSFGY